MPTNFIQPRKRRLTSEQMLNGNFAVPLHNSADQDPSFSPPSDDSPDNIDAGFERRDASEMPALDSSVGGRAVSSLLTDEPKPGTAIRQQESPQTDVGTIPVANRFDEVMRASGSRSEPSPTTQAAPAPPSRVQALTDEYDALARDKPKDHNGRVKSLLLNLLEQLGAGARQELASGRPIDSYSLARLGGYAAGGAARGYFDPSIDERTKSKSRMLALQQQIKEAVAIQRYDAQAARSTQGRAPKVATTSAKLSELTKRIQVMGGKYAKGRDKTADALVDELGAAPKQGGGGASFNPAGLKVVDGHLRYAYRDHESGEVVSVEVESSDGQPLPEDDSEQRRLEIMLQQLNLSRANRKLPPLSWEDFMEMGGTPSQASPGNNQTPNAVPAPASGIRPRTPKLVIAPGAKPEAVSSGGNRPRFVRRGRHGGASGDSGGGLDKYEQGRLDKAENDAAQSRARAASARARGDDAEAAAHDEAARVAEETANKLRAKKGGNRSAPSTHPQTKKNDPLGILD